MFIYPKNEWKIIFDIIKRNCWIVNWLEKLKFCQFEVTGVLSIHRTQKFTWSPLFHQSCSKVTILFANKFPVRWTSRQGKTIVVHAYLHFFLNIYEENFYYSIRIRGCNFNCENWVCPINFELAKKESHKVQVKKNEYREGYIWLPRIQGHRTQIDSLQNSIFSWLNDISLPLSRV